MRYGILGPLQVLDGSDISAVTRPRMGVLLATLLIRADEVVSREALIDEIWDGNPPCRATATLHVHVSELRKFLGRLGTVRDPIRTQSPGYVLHPEAGELDLHRFRHLVHRGRADARAQQHENAVLSLEAALGMCRGPALRGLTGGPIIREFVRWFDEVRTECAETLVRSSMALGRYQETTGLLSSLLSEYPLHEGFYQHLMLAMSKSGRRAEALSVYRRAQETIKEQVGLEPCRALRDLQRAILLAEDGRAAVHAAAR
ncbi:AfsR/SARP family transcriptional regulator [Saccharopolyspora shandongensis]|uniref:DNA-binding transcriptional activator of the SARP family n=1 Tax=Saccharopolyspora shandongensis TaxID=418495 RepID=A0A1H2UTG8_9PSEU|nr:AfsR/SARP family transcriptional regulator [Saccharopolyspora shandongensis]SDW58889.1 DNA-binding transcriptional activator of the SARP family [Saccharopolyspora shandongensis]